MDSYDNIARASSGPTLRDVSGCISQMAKLRELRLAFLQAQVDNPLPKGANPTQRRARKMDVREFEFLYEALSEWVDSKRGCPAQAMLDGMGVLEDAIASIEGRAVKTRHSMYVVRR